MSYIYGDSIGQAQASQMHLSDLASNNYFQNLAAQRAAAEMQQQAAQHQDDLAYKQDEGQQQDQTREQNFLLQLLNARRADNQFQQQIGWHLGDLALNRDTLGLHREQFEWNKNQPTPALDREAQMFDEGNRRANMSQSIASALNQLSGLKDEAQTLAGQKNRLGDVNTDYSSSHWYAPWTENKGDLNNRMAAFSGLTPEGTSDFGGLSMDDRYKLVKQELDRRILENEAKQQMLMQNIGKQPTLDMVTQDKNGRYISIVRPPTPSPSLIRLLGIQPPAPMDLSAPAQPATAASMSAPVAQAPVAPVEAPYSGGRLAPTAASSLAALQAQNTNTSPYLMRATQNADSPYLSRTKAAPKTDERAALIAQADDVIRRGAPPEKVKARLKEMLDKLAKE